MRKKRIKYDEFHHSIDIFCSDNYKYFRIKFGINVEADGQCSSNKRGHIVIIFDVKSIKDCNKYEVYGIVCHECWHAVSLMMQYIGQERLEQSEEIIAYMLQHITEIAMKFVDKELEQYKEEVIEL